MMHSRRERRKLIHLIHLRIALRAHHVVAQFWGGKDYIEQTKRVGTKGCWRHETLQSIKDHSSYEISLQRRRSKIAALYDHIPNPKRETYPNQIGPLPSTLTPFRISEPARLSEAPLGIRNELAIRGDPRSLCCDEGDAIVGEEMVGDENGVENSEGGVWGEGEGGGETEADVEERYKGKPSTLGARLSAEELLLWMGVSQRF
jgi:hypothetical protein